MYIELESESRGYSVTTDSVRQTFVYAICNDASEYEQPDDPWAEFFSPNDDIGIALFVYETFPIYRNFPISTISYLTLILVEHSAAFRNKKWYITLTYSIPPSYQPGSYLQLNLELGGETVHVSQSLGVSSSETRIGLAMIPPDVRNTIGITADGVQGADIPGGGLRLSLTDYYAPTLWSTTLIATWYSLFENGIAPMNDDTFKGFAAGTMLLLSIQAQGEMYKKVPVTFQFSLKPNNAGVIDLPFDPIVSYGHDLITYQYYEGVDSNFALQTPTFRYIHQVHPFKDFSLLGL